MNEIIIGTLGGTIAMVEEQKGVGALPRLDAAALLRSVPSFSHEAGVRAESLLQLPSASLSLKDVLSVLDWCRRAAGESPAGIVLTQGTDTLEEVAYLLDLFWDSDVPLVVTGAMRTPMTPGADGPSNLLRALETARDPASRGRGVLVVMNDTIHSPRWVTKADALAADAFRSPDGGILGRVVEGWPCYFAAPATRETLPMPARRDHEVALVTSVLGQSPDLLRHALSSGHYAGVVVAAFGAGHVAAADAELVGEWTGRLPVVIASRTGGGSTASATYGFVGSEVDLAARGALLAGWLSPFKARILLWAIIASQQEDDAVRALFMSRTGPQVSFPSPRRQL